MIAELFFTRAGGVIIRTPYLQDFVDELKALVPPAFRHWDKEEKVWYIEPSYANEAAELFWDFFPDSESFNLARNYREPPWWAKVLYVQPDAPREVCEAAYRALARIHHPDVGGSDEQMRVLNQAIAEAREAKGPQQRAEHWEQANGGTLYE